MEQVHVHAHAEMGLFMHDYIRNFTSLEGKCPDLLEKSVFVV